MQLKFAGKIIFAAAVCWVTAAFTGPFAHSAVITVNPGDNLKAAVEGAAAGDIVELSKGKYVLSDSDLSITVPSGVAVMADPAAPLGSVVVQAGNNSTSATIFRSTGSDITISGLKFVPGQTATLGGRAVWVPAGGENLVFSDNIVERFTDAMFALFQTGGAIEFTNNKVTIVDRDPDNNTCDPDPPNNCLGGNAGLTVLFSNLDSLDASGNTIRGPGRNVERFLAVVGIIIFNTTQTIDTVSFWNNAIKGFDNGIFTSGEVGGGSGVTIAENRIHNNGIGIQAGQVPDPDITIPTPSEQTLVSSNRITGNDFGIFIDLNGTSTTIERNQIAGNREAAILDDGINTIIGANLIRGKNTGTIPGGPPSQPHGQQFNPVNGPTGG